MDDWRLLREYLDQGSEAAFADLVKRHVNLVYSVALRRLAGNADAAEEVAQSVFCLLARKARRLGPDTALVSWLYQTTCYTALKHWRTESRRREREQQATLMNPGDQEDADAAWQQLAPIIDEAVKQLAEADRVAILLRFFERKPLRAVGEALGIGEDAARMRINRALEKLRGYLGSRAICTPALLATVLAERAVEAAPAAAARSIEAAALSAAKVAAVPSAFLTMVMIMANAKLKITGIVALGALLGSAIYIANKGRDENRTQADRTSIVNASIPSQRPERVIPTAMPAGPAPQEPAATDPSVPLEEFRKTLFSPVLDSMWPSPDLISAIHGLGPANSHLAIPSLIEGLQSTDTNVNKRAAHALMYLALAANRGKWSKSPILSDQVPDDGWQTIDAEPLRQALLDAMPALRNTIRAGTDLISQTAAITAATTIDLRADLLPDIVEGMKAARGHRSAVGEAARKAFTAHPESARALLQPLLNETDEELRVAAACSSAALPGTKEPAALAVLVNALGKRVSDLAVLDAIALYGSEAKSYLPALMQRSEALFKLPSDESYVWELKDRYCGTLAAIDPELRHKVPELDQWFQEKEQLANLKTRVADPSAALSELVEALKYRETRYDALKRLGDLGPSAAEALPALRKELKNSGKFAESLDVVGNTIKRIDPESPAPYFGRLEVMPAINAVMKQAEALDQGSRDALMAAFNENSWGAMYTPADLAALANRVGTFDPRLRESFVTKLIEKDPKLEDTLRSQK